VGSVDPRSRATRATSRGAPTASEPKTRASCRSPTRGWTRAHATRRPAFRRAPASAARRAKTVATTASAPWGFASTSLRRPRARLRTPAGPSGAAGENPAPRLRPVALASIATASARGACVSFFPAPVAGRTRSNARRTTNVARARCVGGRPACLERVVARVGHRARSTISALRSNATPRVCARQAPAPTGAPAPRLRTVVRARPA
jgi:hypothetical protein